MGIIYLMWEEVLHVYLYVLKARIFVCGTYQ